MKVSHRNGSVVTRAIAVALAASSCLGGCHKDAPAAGSSAPAAPTAPAAPQRLVTLDPAQTAVAAGIPAQVQNGRLPSSVAVKANARAILSVAETSADPTVTAAALLALPSVFTHAARFTQNRELMGPEYAEIVKRHLQSAVPQVQGAAIRASVTCILGDTPNAEILTALTDLAAHHPSPEGRYDAMEILWNSSVIRTTPAQMAPYLAALDAPQPWLVSTALFRINGFSYNVADKPALATRLIALTRHADPGVRGRAAQILGSLASSQAALAPQIAAALMLLLDDPNAFTKSEAMDALAMMDHRPALPRIVAMLDDQTRNTYDIGGFRNLLGASASVHHDGSAWSRISDAALNAIRTYSSRMHDPFRYEIRYQSVDADLATSATAARAWFARHQAEIPPA